MQTDYSIVNLTGNAIQLDRFPPPAARTARLRIPGPGPSTASLVAACRRATRLQSLEEPAWISLALCGLITLVLSLR